MKFLSVLAVVLMSVSVFSADGLDCGFDVGCNYWASHAGTEMWRRWDAQVVEKDFAALEAHGMSLVRVFPIWRDFQPIVQLRRCGNLPVEIAWKDDGPLPNPAGVDDEMVARFRTLCDTARRHNLKLIVGLITGFMSSRAFVPPALDGTYIERELGLFKADRTPKPTVLAMRDFASFLETLPFGRLPGRKREAVCLLSDRMNDAAVLVLGE